MKRLIIVVTVLGLGGLQLGCGSSSAGACDRIAEACHDKDMGEGPAFECHELAEGGAEGDTECAEKEQECTDVCAE